MTSKDDDYPSVSQVIGSNVRALREERGWRQEDLAKRARSYGLGWNRPTVAAVETGIRAVSVEELPLLAITLGAGMDKLLAGKGRVRLTEEAAGELEAVHDLYCGGDPGNMLPGQFDLPTFRTMRDAMRTLRAAKPSLEKHFGEVRRLWPKASYADLIAAEETIGDDAVKKAARKLETKPMYVAVVARRLWGHGLAEERDARVAKQAADDAPPRTLQALRGHVTRELLAEIEPLLAKEAG